REAFEEVGGFDEDYFMFFEDTQLGHDLKEKGWLSVYAPQALITHDTSKSWRDQPDAMIIAHHKSAETFFAKTHPNAWQAPVRAVVGLGLRARSRFMTKRKK
ncbi:MAG: glycosyltransferase family 2 protein, partial [Actinomycetaceae bacterium]|nr:glycosyltransferase family 2 protein [Actinomycetaceae bacterium]